VSSLYGLLQQAAERAHEAVQQVGSAEARQLEGEWIGAPDLGLKLYLLKRRG
jgi:hypothetical protein